jgi:ATP-dependent Zn protease
MTPEHVARHEAAHAVVAHALRSRVDIVTIEPTETMLGHVVHRHTLDDRAIGAVAAALLERRTLSGDEFREVFAAASEAPA